MAGHPRTALQSIRWAESRNPASARVPHQRGELGTTGVVRRDRTGVLGRSGGVVLDRHGRAVTWRKH